MTTPSKPPRGGWPRLWRSTWSRGGFLGLLTAGVGMLWAGGFRSRKAFAAWGNKLPPRTGRRVETDTPLAVVEGEDPAAATRRAVEALGGISRFVKSGDNVVVKPNIGWDRTPEQAANTNPQVVAALVELCRDAGARTVRVFDNACNDQRRTYASSGIREAAKAAGAMVYYVRKWGFKPGAFPEGSALGDWPVFKDAVECDCLINVPIAKHHGLSRLTLSIKNLMGVAGGFRGTMHFQLSQKLAELTAFFRPDLTVVDAYRILLRNGPTGGNLEDVALRKTVIASADPVLADAYAATLFGLAPADIGYIQAAAEAGLGRLDLDRVKPVKIKI